MASTEIKVSIKQRSWLTRAVLFAAEVAVRLGLDEGKACDWATRTIVRHGFRLDMPCK